MSIRYLGVNSLASFWSPIGVVVVDIASDFRPAFPIVRLQIHSFIYYSTVSLQGTDSKCIVKAVKCRLVFASITYELVKCNYN